MTIAKINFTGKISISPSYVWISTSQKSLYILIIFFFGTHSTERDP